MAAPPLTGSKRLALPDKNSAVRILLHGLSGPVDGITYPSIMPPMEANSDEWIASVASYVRYTFAGVNRAWGRLSPIVKPDDVRKIRAENAGRATAWTLAELEKKAIEDTTAGAARATGASPSGQ